MRLENLWLNALLETTPLAMVSCGIAAQVNGIELQYQTCPMDKRGAVSGRKQPSLFRRNGTYKGKTTSPFCWSPSCLHQKWHVWFPTKGGFPTTDIYGLLIGTAIYMRLVRVKQLPVISIPPIQTNGEWLCMWAIHLQILAIPLIVSMCLMKVYQYTLPLRLCSH